MSQERKRIVVKVGTSTLTYPTGKTNLRHMAELARVLSDILNAGNEAVLVSSGAIGVGVGKLGLRERPCDTRGRQAAASVGQCELMFIYDKLFGEYNHTVAQLLITKSDVDDDERRANLVNTFEQLFAFGALPIVNENDSVAVEEIVYGDNDCLSANVAKLVGADLLVILTDCEGLFDRDPGKHPDARLIPVVSAVTPEIEALAGGAGSELGTGGMLTKLHAARIAAEAHIDTVVACGTPVSNLYDILDGKSVGTLFLGKGEGV